MSQSCNDYRRREYPRGEERYSRSRREGGDRGERSADTGERDRGRRRSRSEDSNPRDEDVGNNGGKYANKSGRPSMGGGGGYRGDRGGPPGRRVADDRDRSESGGREDGIDSRSRKEERGHSSDDGRRRRSVTPDDDDDNKSSRRDRGTKEGHRQKKQRTKEGDSGSSRSGSESESDSSSSSHSDRDRKLSSNKGNKHSTSSKNKSRPEVKVPPKPVTKEEKEMMKMFETPEEKRARRLEKKEDKARKRKELMGWDQEYMGYTNKDNPFGDSRLLESFNWKKKQEKEGLTGLRKEDLHKIQRAKLEETRHEIQKVKQRRLEREKELAAREEEVQGLMREKESAYFKEWEEQEDSFHLQQAKLRSEIRVTEGRAKPIDLLAKYISAEDNDLAVEMHEPYTFLNGLTLRDLEDLLEDITVYMELEEGKNAEYWKDITTIVEDEIYKLRKLDPDGDYQVRDRREGIKSSVLTDVQTVFKTKTVSQLLVLSQQINSKISSHDGVDIGYWESLLQQLKAHMARMKLKERHQEVLRSKLHQLKREQGVEEKPLFPVESSSAQSPSVSSSSPFVKPDPVDEPQESAGAIPTTTEIATEDRTVSEEPGPSGETEADPAEGEEEDSSEEKGAELQLDEDPIEQSCLEYESGRYSPSLLVAKDVPPDVVVYDPTDDMKRLEFARCKLKGTGSASLDSEAKFIQKAKENMGDDEAQFSVELPVEHSYLWTDKYRPRKPRYFNRVHTGFEWNKYNQTHYDMDNPPPKIVQGYKFNIFYPDLMDKRNTPQYHLLPSADNKDFSTLKFSSGPPYEDIAFKVVNREWEYSHKKGFRCQYSNGIFQLWFHFKRYRYRR